MTLLLKRARQYHVGGEMWRYPCLGSKKNSDGPPVGCQISQYNSLLLHAARDPPMRQRKQCSFHVRSAAFQQRDVALTDQTLQPFGSGHATAGSPTSG